MKFATILTVALSAAFLSACGGGGGDSTPAVSGPSATAGPTAEGVYNGSLTGSTTSTAFSMLILENGEIWSMYGTQTANVFGIAGFVQGTGSSNNGSFSSSDAKDFGYAPAVGGTATATYDATAKTISGTVKSGSSSISFTGGPSAGSLYNYNTAASLTTIAGSWSTTSLTGEGVALTVAASGAFTAASTLGCHFSGSITPRPSGKNVFNVAFTFGASPCALPNTSATGIAVAYPITGGRTQLLVAAIDGTRTYGAAVVGIR